MARIPFLSADQTAGSGGDLPTALGAQPATAIGQAAGQVASTFDQFEQQYVQARRLSAAAQLNAESYQRLSDAEFKASQIPDRAAAIAQYQTDTTAIKNDMGGRIIDPLLKANWESTFDQRQITGQIQAGHAAFGLESNAQQAGLASRMEGYSHQSAAAGSDIERAQVIDTATADIKAMIAGHWISPLQGEEHLEKFRQRGDAALARSDINADPSAAVKKLQDPSNYPWLDEYRREMMLGVAESRARARSDEAKGVALQNHQDNFVSILTTGEPVTPPQSKASLVAMFGTARGNKMAADLVDAQQIFGFSTKTKLTSPAEDQALLAAHKPSGTGFADQQQVYNTLADTVQKKQRALTEDPAAYAYQAAPELAQAMQAAQKDPAKMPAAVAMLDSVYDRLGQPTYNRPVMSDAYAADLAKNVMQAPADQRAQALNAMGEAYGSAWPRVMGDMVKNGKLPTAYEILPAIPNAADRITYANALGSGKRPLKDLIDPEDVKTVENGIRISDTLKSLRQSAAWNDRGGKKADDIEEAARLLAYAKVQQGMPASSAADSAVNAIIGDKFDFVGPGAVRAPKGLHDQVETYGKQVLRNLTPEDLPVPANPAGKKLTDAQLRQTYLDSIRRKGVWVTNENGDGMVMLDEQRNPVMLKNGQRLEAPFSAARATPLPTVTPDLNFIAP